MDDGGLQFWQTVQMAEMEAVENFEKTEQTRIGELNGHSDIDFGRERDGKEHVSMWI